MNNPSFFEKLYRHDGIWNKYDWSFDAHGVPTSTICTIDHHLHKRRRAPLNPFFSKANVASRQDVIFSKVEKLAARIAGFAGSGSEFNLGAAISALAVDVVAEYILGQSYDVLDREDFGKRLMTIIQGSGSLWRLTKHVRFFGPVMKGIPLPLLNVVGSADVTAFVAFLMVGASLVIHSTFLHLNGFSNRA